MSGSRYSFHPFPYHSLISYVSAVEHDPGPMGVATRVCSSIAPPGDESTPPPAGQQQQSNKGQETVQLRQFCTNKWRRLTRTRYQPQRLHQHQLDQHVALLLRSNSHITADYQSNWWASDRGCLLGKGLWSELRLLHYVPSRKRYEAVKCLVQIQPGGWKAWDNLQ